MNVINVKVKYLRPKYNSLKEWLAANPDHIYIGRNNLYVEGAEKSKWANPFTVKEWGRDECLSQYEQYIRNTPDLWNQLEELNGKILGCWCHPESCHGHILQKLLDEKRRC